MSGGVPPSSRAGKRRKPSAGETSDIQRAADLYQRFSGHEAEIVGRVNIRNLPKVGVAIGTIDGILYTTVRDGQTEKFIHQFKSKDKPMFVVSPDGKQLLMVGGNYDFTERGIVDESDKS